MPLASKGDCFWLGGWLRPTRWIAFSLAGRPARAAASDGQKQSGAARGTGGKDATPRRHLTKSRGTVTPTSVPEKSRAPQNKQSPARHETTIAAARPGMVSSSADRRVLPGELAAMMVGQMEV